MKRLHHRRRILNQLSRNHFLGLRIGDPVTSRFVIVAFAMIASVLNGTSATAQSQDDDFYSQRLTIRFTDEESAKKAVVAIEPLFNGHYRAVSCRWDDNWTSDNQGTRDLMEKFGIRGTWYLNDRDFSPENRPADYLPVAKELLRGGNSIGGHSLTHPFITYFHSNRMFAEMSGVRIAWESALDRPVLSYAYSFVDVSPGPEHHIVLHRTLDALTRSGFDHVAEYLSFFENVEMHQELSPIMPPENNPFEAFRSAVDWAYKDIKLTQNYPMITNSMHAWYDTPRLNYGYDELKKRFELLTSLEDVWHCNQNEYAGYRRQFKNAALEKTERIGNTLTFTLKRLCVLVLNDDTPLTFAISGVPRQAIASIDCSDGAVTMSDRKDGDRIRFHVPHGVENQLPRRIGHIANPDNDSDVDRLDRDQDFPKLGGGLFANGQTLTLALRSEGDQSLEDLRVVWRAPAGYDVDTVAQYVDPADGNSLEVSRALKPAQNLDSRWGREHFAAQVDFCIDGEPVRLHLTCQRPGEEPDDSLPREGFSILGPIDPNAVTNDDLQTMAKDNWEKQRWAGAQWEFPSGSDLKWSANARDGYVRQEWLNPEYVRTMGTWDPYSQTYVLRSTVWSPEKRRTHLTISHPSVATTWVNGKKVDGGELDLEKGENRVLVIYPGCSLGVGTQRVTACFFRLSDPKTGKRFRDIRYQAF